MAARNKIITVPGANIAALYAAVYDENGHPRDHVEINLEPGLFVLDPSKPFDGRLVLGEKTILRSSFKMVVDVNGIPQLSTSNEPIVLHAGAKIDGSNLPLAPYGEGIIMVGHKALVEQIWVAGGARPGIEIISQGTARHIASTGHTLGLRVRAAGHKAQATVEEILAAGNTNYGIALDPALNHPTHACVDVKATLQRNVSVNNGFVNLFIAGGLGTDGSNVQVRALHNSFGGGILATNIRVVGGFDFQAYGSANNNRVKFTLNDNLIAGGPVGIVVEGGTLNSEWLADPSLPLATRQSSQNAVSVKVSNTTFTGNHPDIAVFGAVSSTHEAGGDYNAVQVMIKDHVLPITIQAFDCFPQANFSNCTNTVRIRL